MLKKIDFVYLTPELFHRLDSLTRSKVRRLILVLPPDKMENALAAASFWAGSVCVNPEADPKERRYGEEVGVIHLVNQVNVREFNSASRPEMDWAAVPPQMIYEFLIWHEIGHLVMGHVIGLNIEKAPWLMDAWERRLAGIEMERRADRYAWKVLFPNSFLPVRRNPKIDLKELDKFAGKYKRFFEQPEKSYSPLMSTQGSMVLKSHLEEGIPWADPVARRLKEIAA